MSDQTVYLKGHIDVPADRLDAVREALPLHIELTHAEAGCLSFEVIEDTTQKGRFWVSESFADQAAFDAHQERTKASAWAKVAEGIPREYEVRTGQPFK